MEPIRLTTQKLINTWQGLLQTNRENILRSALESVFTKKEQRHIKSWALENSRITLRVDASVWFYLINLKKGQLLKRLNKAFRPEEAIAEIILQLDNDEAKR